MSTPTSNPSNPESDREAVYNAVRAVPSGTVITYGDLAEAVGRPRTNALAVAMILGSRPGADDPDTDIPWWRVVRADGGLLGPNHEMTENRKVWVAWAKARLMDEGVVFTNDGRVANIAGRSKPSGGGSARVVAPEPCWKHDTVQYSCRDCAPAR